MKPAAHARAAVWRDVLRRMTREPAAWPLLPAGYATGALIGSAATGKWHTTVSALLLLGLWLAYWHARHERDAARALFDLCAQSRLRGDRP